MTFQRGEKIALWPVLPVLAMLLALLPLTGYAAPGNERRIALVIGIGSYQNAPHLTNPVNDARAIGDSLRRLKFDVTELYDADFRELNSGIRSFGIRAAAADVAVVYYAGHGVQVDRENYLIPADAKLERERDLLYEAMPLDRLMGEVSQASRIGIVLLDSCRNNPFIDRVARSMTIAGRAVATTAGLARVDNVPRNTMVVMAAKADQIAEDGSDHSPFAGALLAHFQIPGLELSLFFRSVRDTVLRSTNNRQEPYVFSSLGAEPFYFYPRPPNRPPEIAAINPLEVTESGGPTPLGMPQPTDPDQDPLTVRIIGLPRSGEVRIDGKAVLPNTVVSPERFKTAVFKPDGKSVGSAGTLDILIEDGRGGSITASLPIVVRSSHHPPVLGGPTRLQVAQQVLGIPAPVSPDGDPLTVTISALPRGTVRNGAAVLHPGDHVTPTELSRLTFWPEAGFVGPAGTLRYIVDNGHGGAVEGALDIEVGSSAGSSGPAGPSPEIKVSEPVPPKPAVVAMVPPDVLAPGALPPGASPPAPSRVMTASNGPLIAPPATQPRANNPGANVPSAGGQGGNKFQDCPTCPVMIRIPAGGFTMGQGAREQEAMPPHRVDIGAFALGQTPVTVAEWKACLAAKGCSFMPRMRVSDDRTPVHNVSWEDVGQYMAWLTKTTGHPYRLPSEAEWEYAARGGTTTRYWWGESVGMFLANCSDCGGAQDVYGPLPVDALQANPFGLYGMLGGVSQWTADCWFPNYRGAPADAKPREAKACDKRVLRGGSFRAQHDEITVTYRGNYDAPVRYVVNGFRVARDPD